MKTESVTSSSLNTSSISEMMSVVSLDRNGDDTLCVCVSCGRHLVRQLWDISRSCKKGSLDKGFALDI